MLVIHFQHWIVRNSHGCVDIIVCVTICQPNEADLLAKFLMTLPYLQHLHLRAEPDADLYGNTRTCLFWPILYCF